MVKNFKKSMLEKKQTNEKSPAEQTKNARKARVSIVRQKHKRVLNRISENMGKPGKRASIKQAMIDEGYSESYAKSGLFQKTKGWGELTESFLPDEELAKTHRELLRNQNWRARDSALEMAYKLKKKYTADITIENKYAKFTDEELEKMMEESLISMISHDRSGTIARIVKQILEKHNAFKT